MTLGTQIIKSNTVKVRRLHSGSVLAGFAGSTADAMTLLELFEKKLGEHGGNLMRAAVELGKQWRTDRMLRRLEAMMLVADKTHTILLSGAGDIIEPEHDVAAIGSGAAYALAAARAFLESSDWEAEQIARRSLEIAATICIYTDDVISMEVIS